MNVKKSVFEILKELSSVESIKLTDSLQQNLALDSLGLVMLLIEIENQFQIELKESDMNPFDLSTVSDVITLVERYGVCDEE